MTGTLVQVSASPGGGMPKPALMIAHVEAAGVRGDWQRNRKHHGGPRRAVCLYSVELYERLAGQGIALSPGDLGENFTTEGIDLDALQSGDRFRVGASCLIELTDPRIPCASLRKWDARLPGWLVGHSGWLAKVTEPGDVKPGDAIVLWDE